MKKFLILIILSVVSVTPLFSQKIDSEFRVFNYTSFNNSGHKYKISCIWCPEKIDNYSIMCIQAHEEYAATKNYLMLPKQSMAESWTENLTAMKELFIKNDSIAKDNAVASDIKKNISDKFDFTGIFGEGITRYSIYGPIKKNYSGSGYEYCVIVLYKYTAGQSSMELYIGDYYLNHTQLLWTFNNVQDFEVIINAINWSNFDEAFNKQVSEYKQQQEAVKAAAEKQKNESALFD